MGGYLGRTTRLYNKALFSGLYCLQETTFAILLGGLAWARFLCNPLALCFHFLLFSAMRLPLPWFSSQGGVSFADLGYSIGNIVPSAFLPELSPFEPMQCMQITFHVPEVNV